MSNNPRTTKNTSTSRFSRKFNDSIDSSGKGGNKTEKEAALKLEDLPVLQTKRWHITLSAVIGMIGSIISITYVAVDYIRIKPLEKELDENRVLLSNARAESSNAKAQSERFEQKLNALAFNIERPALVFPPDKSSLVGLNISFIWEFGKHEATSKYILELEDLSGRNEPLKLNVDRPETKSMFYAFDSLTSGSYLWRIRPGVIVSGQEVAQGASSPPAIFHIYTNIIERIKSTGKLLIATTPTSYDQFVGVTKKGQYDGFELKLLRWLMPRIGNKLGLKQTPNLEIVEVPWNRLFTYMQNGEADIAVRSITRSEAREREYPNLRFTSGYIQNHQIFVQLNRDGVYPDSLKGRVVGAKAKSVNEAAAKYLAQKYGFDVNSSFVSYGDLYEGLRRGEVAFALVDSSLVSEYLNKTMFPVGGFLDNELRSFYQKELGFDHEEYSILVHEGGSDELRKILDDIFSSNEYKDFLKSFASS